MLNRTNRTLSANLNRLNLGTRSLVLVTGLNNGNATLRVRHAREDAMRDGMYRSFEPAITPSSWFAIPSIPCSSPVCPWPGQLRPSSVTSRRVVVPVVRSVDVDVFVNLVDDCIPTFADSSQDPKQFQTPARALKPKGRAEIAMKSTSDSRSRLGLPLVHRFEERRTETAAAAKTAAAKG